MEMGLDVKQFFSTPMFFAPHRRCEEHFAKGSTAQKESRQS